MTCLSGVVECISGYQIRQVDDTQEPDADAGSKRQHRMLKALAEVWLTGVPRQVAILQNIQ